MRSWWLSKGVALQDREILGDLQGMLIMIKYRTPQIPDELQNTEVVGGKAPSKGMGVDTVYASLKLTVDHELEWY